MSAESRMELSRRNDDAAARAHAPLRHVQGKTLNLGPVPFKYLQEDFGAAVLPIKPLSDKQCRLRYVALVQAASVTDVKVDEVAADHGHDFVRLAGEFACLSDLAEVPISGVQVRRSDHYAAVRVTVPPQLRERETLNLGPVPYKYFDELSAARLSAPRPLSDQQRGACYSAPFDISTVLHNEIDGIFTKISHEDDPPLRSIETRGGRLGSAPIGAG